MSRTRCPFVLLALAALMVTCVLPGCGNAAQEGLKDPAMQATPPVQKNQELTIDDLLYTQGAVIKGISPDASMVAWSGGGYVAGSEDPVADLFVTEMDSLSTRLVVSLSGDAPGDVQWSPDSSTLAFISHAEVPGDGTSGEKGQVWSWDRATGSVTAVTQAANGVQDYAWKDGAIILYTSGDGGENEENPADDTIHVTEFAQEPVRLFELDLEAGTDRRLTQNDDRITDLFVSPDGSRAVLIRTEAASESLDCQYYGNIPIETCLLDLETSSEKQVFEDVKQPTVGSWSPDSSTFYLLEADCPDNPAFAYTVQVREMDAASGEEKKIDLGWERGIRNYNFMHATENGFIAMLADGCNPKLASYTRSGDGWEREIFEGEHQGNISSWDVSRGEKRICYMYSTASRPPQAYVASLDDGSLVGPRQFTALNPGFEDKVFAASENITWTGARGDTVEGMLYYPAGYQPGRKYPLVVTIHGGPFGVIEDKWGTSYERWAYPYQLLTRKGAFVLDPNYHGSSSYGFDFADSIKDGKYYEYPLEDIENGISRLVELGMVDEGRLGTLGWSNGSILSHALIATDNRFKAASCGAGGAEWVSLWGECTFGDGIVSYYFGDDPVAQPGMFKDPGLAPFYDAEKVETPVLMFGPAEDTSVPPVQVWVTYRGLQKHGKAPVELFVFPGEPHVLQKLSHQRRKMVEEQEWFDRYLFESEE
ncbi:MAG: S9 family peptidase [Actinobacteria bacterium]|nr:S9 family peptidase [Actinomycetota bacterium]